MDFDFAFEGVFVFELEPAATHNFVIFVTAVPGEF
jgi:hypothetical protein